MRKWQLGELLPKTSTFEQISILYAMGTVAAEYIASTCTPKPQPLNKN